MDKSDELILRSGVFSPLLDKPAFDAVSWKKIKAEFEAITPRISSYLHKEKKQVNIFLDGFLVTITLDEDKDFDKRFLYEAEIFESGKFVFFISLTSLELLLHEVVFTLILKGSRLISVEAKS